MPWIVFDAVTNRPAGYSGYFSYEQAAHQIEEWKIRQARGGRPDIDCSGYVPRWLEPGEKVVREKW